MELVDLARMELTYRTLESIDYGVGGQLYGVMEGTIRGDRLSGTLHLTNLAQRRSDGVNSPTLRGLLTLEGGGRVWVELDGLATLRERDQARVFVTGCRFRTGDEEHGWLNAVVGLVEGVLDTVGVGGVARAQVYECRATLT